MQKGKKAKPKAAPRSPLTARVPPGLTGAAAAHYRTLARDLAAEGYACQADWRTVAVCATTQAHADRLAKEVDALTSLTTTSREGETVHALVRELRAVRNQLAAMYAQLLLTPRSRSASRMTEAQARQAATRTDSLEEFLGD
jgi:phage terminase small subunit